MSRSHAAPGSTAASMHTCIEWRCMMLEDTLQTCWIACTCSCIACSLQTLSICVGGMHRGKCWKKEECFHLMAYQVMVVVVFLVLMPNDSKNPACSQLIPSSACQVIGTTIHVIDQHYHDCHHDHWHRGPCISAWRSHRLPCLWMLQGLVCMDCACCYIYKAACCAWRLSPMC